MIDTSEESKQIEKLDEFSERLNEAKVKSQKEVEKNNLGSNALKNNKPYRSVALKTSAVLTTLPTIHLILIMLSPPPKSFSKNQNLFLHLCY
ncbi:hypothetical protein E1A91_A11G340400v1 [Gossypium mustelinum]|uniref:Uncharacterized protein n=2 Tax=Gossypium TaxID=3633 RepID=A0A5D2XEG5_GOSMU|nr:hypothetical protein ES288_A11G363700v1 [Gossypium darwinii]TYJ12306.1 hypothetical protein E1A91_A11G340400v1 [Gossypium mustelinum]